MADHYKKVPGHRYLYRLGSAFYFRRNVPIALRTVFGKTAVSLSLGATSLAVARHKLAEHLRDPNDMRRSYGEVYPKGLPREGDYWPGLADELGLRPLHFLASVAEANAAGIYARNPWRVPLA